MLFPSKPQHLATDGAVYLLHMTCKSIFYLLRYSRAFILIFQRWKNMVTLVTPSVLIFSSCANFLDFQTILCTILRISHNFVVFLSIFAKICNFLLIFARLCIYLYAFSNSVIFMSTYSFHSSLSMDLITSSLRQMLSSLKSSFTRSTKSPF